MLQVHIEVASTVQSLKYCIGLNANRPSLPTSSSRGLITGGGNLMGEYKILPGKVHGVFRRKRFHSAWGHIIT